MEDGLNSTLVFPFVGLVFIAFGLPLKHGKVPPNPWYGFRTRKTLSDPEIWYPINKITGQDMVRAGIVQVLTWLLVLSFDAYLSLETAIAIQTSVIFASVLWMVIHGFSALREL